MIVRMQRSKGNQMFADNDRISCEVYIDTHEDSGFRKVKYPDSRSEPKGKFQLALGNSVNFCSNAQKQAGASEYTTKFFNGRISLPFFCSGLPDFGAMKEDNADTQRCVKEAIMDMINTK